MFMWVVVLLLVGANGVQISVTNRGSVSMWIGIFGSNGQLSLENGGFILNSNERRDIMAPDNWSGRFWARTWCNPSTNYCETGDCGTKLECFGSPGNPPATFADITLRLGGGEDTYGISLVDGFNVPAMITPINGQGNCKPISCPMDLNQSCPNDLKVIGTSGDVIACKSACLQYNTDEYCCRGDFGTKDTCITNNWSMNSASFFEQSCPDAYSYAFDNLNNVYTCTAQSYEIAFG